MTAAMSNAACIDWLGLYAPADSREPAAIAVTRRMYATAVCTTCPILIECEQWAR